MSEKYKNSFRGYLVDNHSPAPPIVTLENLDPKEFERFFQTAHINQFMLYCKDHWGHSFYDTKIGKIHEGLKEDWVARLVPVLRKHDIEFTAYYCFEYDTYAPKAHPEWSVRQSNGEPLICGSGTNSTRIHWGMPCYETGYRDYVMGQLREIVKNYHPDSLFIDIFGKSLCYCENCKARYKRRFGYDLPETEEELLQKNQDVVQFLDEQAEEMLDEVKREMKLIDPTLAIAVNFASHYPKQFRDKLDYIFTEPWAGNWLSGAYARDTSNGKYPQLGPGDVSAVYNYRKDTIYQLAAAEIAAQNCRVFMYSEPMHYDGTLDFTEAEKIGGAYREIEQFEQYLTERKIMADIAIVQSDQADSLIVKHPIIARSIARAKEGGLHRKALLGAMKLCDYSKYTWQVVPEQELDFERMKQYRIILLPNLFFVSDKMREELEHYVREGGCILTAGETGLYDKNGRILEDFALAKLIGAKFLGKNEKYKANDWSAFITKKEDAVWKYCEKTTPPISRYSICADSRGARVLGTFREPVTELTETTWVNWGCPPPGKETGWPAVMENSYGKGKAVQCCFDYFCMAAEEFHWAEGFFEGILEKYIEPSVYLSTKDKHILEYTCYDRAEKKELIFHELSAMAKLANGDTPQIPGGKLYLKGLDKKVLKVLKVYPDKKEMEVHEEDGGVTVELDKLKIHNIYQIQYE